MSRTIRNIGSFATWVTARKPPPHTYAYDSAGNPLTVRYKVQMKKSMMSVIPFYEIEGQAEEEQDFSKRADYNYLKPVAVVKYPSAEQEIWVRGYVDELGELLLEKEAATPEAWHKLQAGIESYKHKQKRS